MFASAPHIAFVKFDTVFAEKNAKVNRAVSASEYFLTKTWGVAPGWYSYRAFGASDPRFEKIVASLAPKEAK